MSRVNENREAQRLEAERMQNQQNKEKTDGKKFQAAMDKKGPLPEKGEKLATTQGQVNAKAAFMAKQGFASQMANKFAQANKAMDQKSAQVKTSERNSDVTESRDEFHSVTDEKTDNRLNSQDKLAAIQRDESEGGQSNGEGAGGQGSQMSGRQDAQSSLSTADGAINGATNNVQGATAAGAQGVQIPQEVLDKLVEQIRVGVNAEGMSEFQIQLKDGVLAGSNIKITSENGKIKMTVDTDNSNTRRLFQASEGQLARAFDRKGLQLETMVVNQN